MGPEGPQGIQGEPGPKGDTGDTGPAGPSAVSTDEGNTATLGSDSLIYVPASEGGGGGSTTQPHLWAYRHTNQSLGNQLDYVANFARDGANEGGWVHYGSGHWTVPAAGLYQVVWYYRVGGATVTALYATPLVNDSPALPEMAAWIGAYWLGTAFVRVGAGQRVGMHIRASGGHGMVLVGNSDKMSENASFMQWTKVSD